MSQESVGEIREVVPGAVGGAPAVPYQPYGAKVNTQGTPRKQWLVGAKGGFHGEIVYCDERFQYKQLPRDVLRKFAEDIRAVHRETQQLEARQISELEALRTEARRNGANVSTAELGDDRLKHYDDQAEKVADRLNDLYSDLLAQGIVGWTLEQSFDPSLFAQFPREDQVALCEELTQRSVAGISQAKK